jgi:hypothetical protein
MHTGDHWACKVIRFKPMPKLGIITEKDFKRKVEARVAAREAMKYFVAHRKRAIWGRKATFSALPTVV